MKGFKNLIVVIIFFVLIFSLVGCSTKKEQIIESTDGKYMVTIPSNINDIYCNTEKSDAFCLDIYSSENGMFIYGSTLPKDNIDYSFNVIVNNDRDFYLANSNNIKDLSELEEFSIKNYTSYMYSYFYTDNEYGAEFYSKVVWIDTKDFFCVINFEVLSNNYEKVLPTFDSIIQSFEVI